MSKFVFDAVKITDDGPTNFNVSFEDQLVPVMREIGKSLVSDDWEVNVMRESLIPWSLEEK